jgi:DNA primase
MAIPPQILQRIEDRTDMVELVGQYVALQRRGAKYWGCCPFHQEKTPSFTVDADRKMFYCFGCKKAGGVFQFVMQIERLVFIEAVKRLAERYGIEIESQENDEQSMDKKALLQLYQKLTSTFEYLLWNSPEGHQALIYARERGLSDQVIKNYRLGYAPSDKDFLWNFLTKRGYDSAFLAKTGLFSKNYAQYPLFRQRLLFPVIQSTGEVVAFSGRILPPNDDGPKYLNSPDTVIYSKKYMLYGLFQAKESMHTQDQFILCEGAFDVCALAQMGYHHAVAPLGSALTEYQLRLLKRYTQNGLVLYDHDEAGIKASVAASYLFAKNHMNGRIVSQEVAKDAGEILQKNLLNELQKSFDNAKIPFEFLLATALQKYPQEDEERVQKICWDLFPFIQCIEVQTTARSYLDALADRFLKDRALIHSDYEKFEAGQMRRSTRVQANMPSEIISYTPSQKILHRLLYAFMKEPQWFDQYTAELPREITDDILGSAMLQYLQTKKDLASPSDFLLQYGHDLPQHCLDYEAKYADNNIRQHIEADFLQLKQYSLQAQKAKIEMMMQRATESGDVLWQKDLANELTSLGKELGLLGVV